MGAAALVLPYLLCLTGALAGLVHDHHHLLGHGDADGHARGGYLEVESQAQQEGETKEHNFPPPTCANTQHPREQAILDGQAKAYAFGGVPAECDAGYGCKSDYWSKWCRYGGGGPPQCPAELQEDLQARLRTAAGNGHSWARDILLTRPCELFTYLEGRTLWIIGDSMSKDFAFAFQCFMLEYWDENNGRWPTDPTKSPDVSDDKELMTDVFKALSKVEPNAEQNPWYLQFCVPFFSGSRMCFLRANDGIFFAESLMPLLPRLASTDDIVLLNFGLHTHGNGTLWGYIQDLEIFAEQYKRLKDTMPQFLWRQTSVQHFETIIGEWLPDVPTQEQRCAPIKSIEIKPDGSLGSDGDPTLDGEVATDMTSAFDTMLRGGRRNVRSAAVMGKIGIPIVHIWNQTVPFWDFHRYYHDPEDGSACAIIACDCTHICVPSWHHMWMASLKHTLAMVGPKGSPRLEVFSPPPDFPIPGINVPLRYLPGQHFVDTPVSEPEQQSS